MKRLAVFCDGTWNRADHVDHGVAAPTNVVKLHLTVAENDATGVEQCTHYERGVGTGRWDHFTGGGLGMGLSGHVLKSYEWLIDHYEDGDELFFFGFSRGAFTARSLAGLVRNSGILRPEHKGRTKRAYRLYRDPRKTSAPGSSAARQFRRQYAWAEETEITFIGVWDTVGALGIPVGTGRIPLLSRLWEFHDTTLSSYVRNAYHAVSIDEQRKPFKPTLWVRKDGEPEVAPDQTVEQVWFAGVHADVGGGYSDTALSEIPLRWMALKASGCGLALKPGKQMAVNPGGTLHDSMSWMYRPLGRYHRRLKAWKGETVRGAVASSAQTRAADVQSYRPEGLTQWLEKPGPITDVDN